MDKLRAQAKHILAMKNEIPLKTLSKTLSKNACKKPFSPVVLSSEYKQAKSQNIRKLPARKK